MMKNKTLKDLTNFLDQNPQQIEHKTPKSKEEFLKSEPIKLVDVPQINSIKDPDAVINITLSDLADFLHQKSKEDKKSFVELWLKILEEGAKKDPLLENTNAFKLLKILRKTSFKVAIEGLSSFIKNKQFNLYLGIKCELK